MRTLALPLLLAAALPLLAQTPAPTPLQEATTACDEDRFDDALRLARPLAAAGDPNAQLIAGKALLALGDFEGATKQLEQAVAKKPNDATVHYNLGLAYGMTAAKANVFSQFSLARKTKEEFERAVALDPRSIDARFALIEFDLRAPSIIGGGDDKALAQAAALRSIDPLWGHRAYARIYVATKKPELARKEYLDALKEQPNSADAHLAYAAFLARDKKFADANAELARVQQLDPNHMPAHYWIGYIAAQSGSDLARGEQSLRRYLDTKPREHDPDRASSWFFLGMVLEKQGRRTDAKHAYATAAKFAPQSKTIQEALKRVS